MKVIKIMNKKWRLFCVLWAGSSRLKIILCQGVRQWWCDLVTSLHQRPDRSQSRRPWSLVTLAPACSAQCPADCRTGLGFTSFSHYWYHVKMNITWCLVITEKMTWYDIANSGHNQECYRAGDQCIWWEWGLAATWSQVAASLGRFRQ